MLDLESAIKHFEEVADYDCYDEKQFKCAEEHRQLAEWLRELKARRAGKKKIKMKDSAELHERLVKRIDDAIKEASRPWREEAKAQRIRQWIYDHGKPPEEEKVRDK